ncbi:carnitine acetyl transferase [Serendipita vermifera]|nr:carnitine acetyl transferase [Serendipita vermifera]
MLPNGIPPSEYSVPLPRVPDNWKTLAPFPQNGNAHTYSEQENLPHLPVPPLAQTLAKLKQSVKAMARDEKEYEETVKKIDEFGKSGGIGEVLHRRLEERREKEEQVGGRGHWLDEWWDDVAYMGYRDSVVINVSYYYGFDLPPSAPTPLTTDPTDPTTPTSFAIQRAASTIRSALLFRHRLLNGLIPADATKQGPLCMDTWRWMFDACRVPNKPSDYALSFSPAEKSEEVGIDGHFIVLRKNHPWKVPNTVVDAKTKSRRLLSTAELEAQLRYIVKQTTGTAPAVGNLTASDRDSWTDDYEVLASISEQNKGVIHDIHSAAFVLCIDDVSPERSAQPSKGPNGNGTSYSTASGSDPVSFSRYLWHGGLPGKDNQLGNRWMDKPVQFVLAPNGEMGIVGEHSVMDGTPTTRMCDEVLDAVYSPSFDHGPASPVDVKPTPLDFDVTPELEQRIASAKTRSDELVGGQALTYHLTDYGKAEIKTYGVGPDGWAQMVVQLAYDRWCIKQGYEKGSRETGGTYEAATTRRFKKGRTEAIRVVSNEARQWLDVMRDASSGSAERKAALVTALKKHINDAKDAGMGMGIDRHLLGLRMLVQDYDGEKALELFNDPLFQRSKKWVLSTSAIFSKHFPVYGWGEVVPDGFGVAYKTGFDDRLQFTITSRKEMDNVGFIREIEQAAKELRALFKEEGGEKKGSQVPPSRM